MLLHGCGHELQVVPGVYDVEVCLRVGFEPSPRGSCLGPAPHERVAVQMTAGLLDPVEFLLRVGAPEVAVCVVPGPGQVLYPTS